MCAIVYYGNEEITNIGDLRTLLPTIVTYNDFVPRSPHCCLCVVDFKATAERNAVELRETVTGDYYLILPGDHARRSQAPKR